MTDLTTEEDLDLDALWNETDEDGADTPVEPAGEEAETEVEDDSDTEEETEEGTEETEEEVEGEEEEEEAAPEIDYQALWTKSQNEVKTMTGRLRASEARLQQENEELAKKVPVASVPPTEEDEFLAKFRETYSDDVVKAIDLITSKKASQLIESSFATRLSPMEAATHEMVTQAHFGAIETVHPDVAEIDASPVFESWLQTRPMHTRAAYEYIRDKGTPAEVISMLDEYKETIGAVKPKPKTTTPVSKAKVAAATAVGRRRGTVGSAAQADANDLAAIWAETDD